MSTKRSSVPSRYLESLAWVLIGVQVLLVAPSIDHETYRRWQFRQQWAKLRRESQSAIHRPQTLPKAELSAGSQVPAVLVRSASGAMVDLTAHARGRQAILFVSSCAPCVADVLSHYEALWRQGLTIRVIAGTPLKRILQARGEYGWKLPIYSDYESPQAALACRVVYRPTVLVLGKNSRVLYVQRPYEDEKKAISQVRYWLQRGDG